MTNVTKEEYWTTILNDPTQMGQITTEDTEFNRRINDVNLVLSNTFINSSDENLISNWETSLYIDGIEGKTLTERKADILYTLCEKNYVPVSIIKRFLLNFIGDENRFVVDFIKDENKLVIQTDHLSDSQLEALTAMVENVIPKNIEFEYDPFPLGYTKVEYLENPKMAYLETNIEYSSDATIKIDFRDDQGASGSNGGFPYLFGGNASGNDAWSLGYSSNHTRWKWNNARTYDYNTIIELGHRYLLELNKTGGYLDGIKKSSISYSEWYAQTLTLFKLGTKIYTSGCKMYSAEVIENGETLLQVVPCLDETGTPCMFDLVSRTTFYNKGSGDFLYPTDAAPTAAIGMDDKFYAKLTDHGVRRLYKVPDGCNMTKDEYAAANGFKEIVEPSQPQTGYWKPQWHETDTQVILEWVETEEPSTEDFNLEHPTEF